MAKERRAVQASVIGVEARLSSRNDLVCTVQLAVPREELSHLRLAIGRKATLVVEEPVYDYRIGDMVDYYPVLGVDTMYRHPISGGPFQVGPEQCWKLEGMPGVVSEVHLRPAGILPRSLW